MESEPSHRGIAGLSPEAARMQGEFHMVGPLMSTRAAASTPSVQPMGFSGPLLFDAQQPEH